MRSCLLGTWLIALQTGCVFSVFSLDTLPSADASNDNGGGCTGVSWAVIALAKSLVACWSTRDHVNSNPKIDSSLNADNGINVNCCLALEYCLAIYILFLTVLRRRILKKRASRISRPSPNPQRIWLIQSILNTALTQTSWIRSKTLKASMNLGLLRHS